MEIILVIFGFIFVLGPIANAIARRISAQTPTQAIPDHGELKRLKDEVERLSSEVARLQDEQSFMVRLLDDGERLKLGEARQNPGDARPRVD